MGRRLKEYLALSGEVERDQAGTPLFCACKARGGKRLSRRHIRVQIDGHLLEAGLTQTRLSVVALGSILEPGPMWGSAIWQERLQSPSRALPAPLPLQPLDHARKR